jgi:cyanophycin synthetase
MKQPGTPEWQRVDDHCRRGGRGVLLESGELGDMILIRHGRRSMQLAWTHLLPATFGGRAVMNVQNAMAAAGRRLRRGGVVARHPPGLAQLQHVVLPGAGRLNVHRRRGHHGRRRLLPTTPPACGCSGDFVDKLTEQPADDLLRHRRIGVVATAGDRRDEDMRELGAVAAHHFDILVVREDTRLRGTTGGRDRSPRRGGCPRRDGSGAPAATWWSRCWTSSKPLATPWTSRPPATSSCCALTATRPSGRRSSSGRTGAGRHPVDAVGDPDL